MRRRRDNLVLDPAVVTRVRLERELARGELAALAHCSARTIWAAHNSVPITLTKGKALARALRVPLVSLCAGGSVAEAAARAEAVRLEERNRGAGV